MGISHAFPLWLICIKTKFQIFIKIIFHFCLFGIKGLDGRRGVPGLRGPGTQCFVSRKGGNMEVGKQFEISAWAIVFALEIYSNKFEQKRQTYIFFSIPYT